MRVPQSWRLHRRNYRLTGQACPQCGAKSLAERAICEACGWPRERAPEGGILVLFDPEPEPEYVPVQHCLRADGRR